MGSNPLYFVNYIALTYFIFLNQLKPLEYRESIRMLYTSYILP